MTITIVSRKDWGANVSEGPDRMNGPARSDPPGLWTDLDWRPIMRKVTPLAVRFWAKVSQKDPVSCWEWLGQINQGGYGVIGLGRRSEGKAQAHRVAYELVISPIPPGLQLDHLCRNRSCVNPAHLEPVTQRVNMSRGQSPAARGARATHCPQKHPYSGDNLYVYPDGSRWCKACRREGMRRRSH